MVLISDYSYSFEINEIVKRHLVFMPRLGGAKCWHGQIVMIFLAQNLHRDFPPFYEGEFNGTLTLGVHPFPEETCRSVLCLLKFFFCVVIGSKLSEILVFEDPRVCKMGRHKQVFHNDTEKITNEAVLAGLTDEVAVTVVFAVKQDHFSLKVFPFYSIFIVTPSYHVTFVARLMLWKHIWTRSSVSSPPPTWATKWLWILSLGKPTYSPNTLSNLPFHPRGHPMNVRHTMLSNRYHHLSHCNSVSDPSPIILLLAHYHNPLSNFTFTLTQVYKTEQPLSLSITLQRTLKHNPSFNFTFTLTQVYKTEQPLSSS